MNFYKHRAEYKIMQPFNLVTDILLDENKLKGRMVKLQVVSVHDMAEMREREGFEPKYGPPRTYSWDKNGNVTLYPTPDRDYSAEVYIARIERI